MTIPVSLFVNVTPGVVAAGGSALAMNGVCVTTNPRVPIGTAPAFGAPPAVSAFFGPNSNEYAESLVYFKGLDISTKTPGAMLFAQYPQSAVAAYLRGGNLVATSLAALQALTGSLTVVMDGYPHVITTISFAANNSFSAIAAAVQAAFTDPTEASFTASIGAAFTASGSGLNLTVSAVANGIISVGDTVAGTGIPANTTIVSQTSGAAGGTGVYVTSAVTTAATASCSALSTVLDVTADTDHTIAAGQTVVGAGVAGAPVITAQISGTTGGTGLYRISGAQQTVVPAESMTAIATAPLVTYDSVSGAFVITSGATGAPSTAAFATGTLAAAMLLTAATGATLSQGAAAATPSAFMTSLAAITQNWASFFLAFDPDNGNGNAQKLLFSQWVNGTNGRYAFVGWDTDVTPTAAVPATSSLGYQLQQANLSGTNLNYQPSNLHIAAFVSGAISAIDFAKKGGRVTFAFKGQAGLVAGVTSQQAAINLGGNPQAVGDFGNGYNYYGAVGTDFLFYQRATVSGPWKWLDSYVNQIWLNSQFQIALLTFMTQVNSFPYNPAGYSLVEAACMDVINAGLNFGAFVPNVPLSAAQIAAVNSAAGADIAGTLSAQGWYFQILPAAASVRQSRASPPIMFWYMDGESIQSLALASTAAQ